MNGQYVFAVRVHLESAQDEISLEPGSAEPRVIVFREAPGSAHEGLDASNQKGSSEDESENQDADTEQCVFDGILNREPKVVGIHLERGCCVTVFIYHCNKTFRLGNNK